MMAGTTTGHDLVTEGSQGVDVTDQHTYGYESGREERRAPARPKPTTRAELRREILSRQRISPVPRERTTDERGRYALTGDAARRYEQTRAQDLTLPDLSVAAVQAQSIDATFARLKAGHTQATRMVRAERTQTTSPIDDADRPLAPRSMKINITNEVAAELGISTTPGKVHSVDFGRLRAWADLPTSATAGGSVLSRLLRPQLATPRAPGSTSTGPDGAPAPGAPVPASFEWDGHEETLRSAVNDLVDQAVGSERWESVFPPALADRRQAKLHESLGEPGSGAALSSAADVTAHHDFHDLRIAWTPIWSDVLAQGAFALATQPPPIVRDFLPDLDPGAWQAYVAMMEDLGENLDDILYAASLFRLNQIRSEIWSARRPPASYPDEFWAEVTELAMVAYGNGEIDKGAGTKVPTYEYMTDYLRFEAARSVEMSPDGAGEKAAFRAKAAYELREEWLGKFEAIADDVPGGILFLPTTVARGYDFEIFAPGSVNYGLNLTYRQAWQPLQWQVGNLVSTIPLAPKEVRKYSKHVHVEKRRARKEIENALRIRRSEDSSQTRAESDIIRRAREQTSFAATSSSGFQVDLGEIGGNAGGSHTFEISASKHSADTKRKLRDAVAKAAREIKDEHRVEVRLDDIEVSDLQESGVIENPNEEITVTYMFFELERMYRVTEALHGVDAVALVAADVPPAETIDWTFLRDHAWILKRALLDDDFAPAFEYALEGYHAIQESVTVAKTRRDAVQALFDDAQQLVHDLGVKRKLEDAHAQVASAALHSLIGRDESIFEDIAEGIFGGGEGTQIAQFEAMAESSAEQIERIGQRLRGAQDEVVIRRSELERATKDYERARMEAARKTRRVDTLRQHVKDNILYYMQAIWSHEPTDQRYMRLFGQKVPFIDYPADDEEVMIRVLDDAGTLDALSPGATIEVVLPPPAQPVTRSLDEVADLNRLLGFKGNYMIFPLRRQSYLTAYMAQSYVGGLVDTIPAEVATTLTLDEMLDSGGATASIGASGGFVKDPDMDLGGVVHDVAAAVDQLGESAPAEVIDTLRGLLESGIAAADRHPVDIIVPTDQLYIEALPGRHPVLEDFKLRHRMLDAELVEAQVHSARMEALRLEMRVRTVDFDDPDVDRAVYVDHTGAVQATAEVTP